MNDFLEPRLVVFSRFGWGAVMIICNKAAVYAVSEAKNDSKFSGRLLVRSMGGLLTAMRVARDILSSSLSSSWKSLGLFANLI